MSTELSTFSFEITSMQQAMDYAKIIADSDLAPKDYKGKPGNVLVAIQYGMEIGLKPLQAIQNIAVINGRPCVWGDAMIALVQGHPLCEYIKESIHDGKATCTVKRRGDEDEYTVTFSVDDAKKAGLFGKAGTWQQYPNRMLQMRARGFALRDKFSDILKGLISKEEAMDYADNENQVPPKRVTSSIVSRLIEAKSIQHDQTALQAVLLFIAKAQDIEQLKAVIEEVKKLETEEDKQTARNAYKQKKETLKALTPKTEIPENPETGEITENQAEKMLAEEENSLPQAFKDVKKQILSANTLDALYIAADLIRECPENLQDKLKELYEQRKKAFNGKQK